MIRLLIDRTSTLTMAYPSNYYKNLFIVILFSANEFAAEQCPSGWIQHQQSCYLFSRTSSQWGSALSICQSLRSNLVEIETTDEDLFLRTYLLNNHKDDKKGIYYVGANDIEVESQYTWSTTRQQLAFTSWAAGQPDAVGHVGDDCVTMDYYSDYLWHDTQCDLSYRFICELALGGDGIQIIG